MTRPAAFFDMDRTLIDINSGILYARHEYREGRIGSLMLARSFFWMGLYHLNLVDIDRAYTRAARYYRGEEASALKKRTRTWFESEVAHRLQPGGRSAIEQHRAEGHPIVLLTNSSCWAAGVATESWGLDHWLANFFCTDASGRLTGEFEPPLCYGAGKVSRAEDFARERDIDLDASWFYSDSLSDLPMLERVANPRVVNPDPRLRRHARRHAWPILDWRETAPKAASVGS